MMFLWNPQNLDFGDPYNTFARFGHPKNIHLGFDFVVTFLVAFRNPFLDVFLTHFAPQGADLSASCRLWVILGPPWEPKSALGAPRAAKRVKKRLVRRSGRRILEPPWARQGADLSASCRLWVILGPPWGPKSALGAPRAAKRVKKGWCAEAGGGSWSRLGRGKVPIYPHRVDYG